MFEISSLVTGLLVCCSLSPHLSPPQKVSMGTNNPTKIVTIIRILSLPGVGASLFTQARLMG